MLKSFLSNQKNKFKCKSAAQKKYNQDKYNYEKMVMVDGGIPISNLFPCLYDYIDQAGDVDGHYFLQDIYVAEKVSQSAIVEHYDIGSRIDGFIGHLLSNSHIDKVVMLDIRPFGHIVEKLDFIQTDATNLTEIPDKSISSLSCLHAVEHFGLGRYGDMVDPMASFKAMKAMQRVLAGGGKLYLSCPIAMKDMCCFNAHRIFSPLTIFNTFDELELIEFSCIQDMKIITYHGEEAKKIILEKKYALGNYDCGIFVFTRL